MGKVLGRMARPIRIIGILIIGAAMTFFPMMRALAQTDPYTGGEPNPPPPCAGTPQIQVNQGQPINPGQTVPVTTTGVRAGGPVTIFVDDAPRASGVADANGTYTANVVAPQSAPNGFIVCASAPPCPLACTQPIFLNNSSTPGGGGGGGGGGNGGGGGGSGGGGSGGGGSGGGGSGGGGSGGGGSAATGGGGDSNVLGSSFSNGSNGTGSASVAGRGFARTGFTLLPWLLAALVCLLSGRQLLNRSRRQRHHSRRRPKGPRVSAST
jgi:hypothetical protein